MRIVFFLGFSLALAFLAAGIMARAQSLLFIGGTVAPVVAPPGVTDVAWTLDPTNSALVTSATLKFAEDLSADSIVCVQVLGDTPPPILANKCFNRRKSN